MPADPVEFTIKTFGVETAAAAIESLGWQATNVKPAMEEIYEVILDIVDETFDTEGARGGFKPWPPNTPVTIDEKARFGLGPGVLVSSGTLRDAMTSPRHPYQSARILKTHIVFAPKSMPRKRKGKSRRGSYNYGRLHQTGEGNMKKRPFIRFTFDDQQAFAKEIERHIMKIARMMAISQKLSKGPLGRSFGPFR